MNFWVITAWDENGEYMNEVMSILFYEPLVAPKVAELFEVEPSITSIRVETWYREEGTDDASFYDWETFTREDMVG